MGIVKNDFPSVEIEKVWELDVLTTGMVAKVCHVAARTVSKWIDSGILRGYRVPSLNNHGGDRRVLKSDLVQFMQQNGMDRLVPRHRGYFGVPDKAAKALRKTDAETWGTIIDLPRDKIFGEFLIGAIEGLNVAKTLYDWCKQRKINVLFVRDEDGFFPEWIDESETITIEDLMSRLRIEKEGLKRG